MAIWRQIPRDSEDKAKGRLATTSADRLRVAKQQLQSSNNAQTKLHTMFEEMIQGLEQTKNQLAEANRAIDDSRDHWETEFQKDLRTHAALMEQEQRNAQLEGELALEKEKARQNEDAKVKLEQLKKQWSSLFEFLSDDETK